MPRPNVAVGAQVAASPSVGIELQVQVAQYVEVRRNGGQAVVANV
jgi:hypothetical protein